jgi:hypothetical protein
LYTVKTLEKLNQSDNNGTVAGRPIGKSIHLLKISEMYHGLINDND